MAFSASTQEAVKIIKGPYVQNVTTTSAVIVWETDKSAPSRVDYGTQANFGKVAEDAKEVKIHEVKLEGLQVETEYRYKVASAGASSKPFIFQTAVKPTSPFSFAVYGDSRSNPDEHAATCDGIITHRPNLIIHTGDIVSSGTVYEQWEQQFFAPAKEMMAAIPFFPSLGNHERNADHYYNFFSLPGKERWYAFTFGNALFIALDSNGEFQPDSEQTRFLEQQLSESKATWKFVYFHHPPYSSGNHGSSLNIRQAWSPIFEKYRVDIVFQGHDHLYERTYPVFDGKRDDERGVTYIVSGGGGAPLYPVVRSEWTAFSQTVHNFQIVRVEGQRLRLETWDHHGHLLDDVTLSKDKGYADTLLRLARQTRGDERITAIQELGALMATKAAPALSALASTPDENTRRAVAKALGRMAHPSSQAVLTRLTQDSDDDVRRWASLGLAQVAESSDAARLNALLGDADATVRRHAAYGLTRVGDDKSASALAKALARKDAPPDEWVMIALTKLGSVQYTPALVNALKRADETTRRTVFLGVSRIAKVKTAVPVLAELLKHDDASTRRYAARVLADVKDRSAVPALIEALADTDPLVRRQVAQSLTAITGQNLGEDQAAWKAWWERNGK
jgi:HEAT repeat protein